MATIPWESGSTAARLRQRADMLQRLRAFFAARGIWEVETPLLSRAAATDVYIQSIPVSLGAAQGEQFYLQTSPEYAMKRLLAQGAGPIYQICKAFRDAEVSSRHNPEFTLLEWYRPGFELQQLMDEVAELVQGLFDTGPVVQRSYQELFEAELSINPHTVALAELEQLLRSESEIGSTDLSKTDCLQLLMSYRIEPRLPDACFVYDYPVEQAALARVENNADGQAVARRFEFYCQGMELANGYQELTDAQEQRRRFAADIAQRSRLGLPTYPIDENLLAALDHGLPDCAGVALGLDRLFMLLCGEREIDRAMSFSLSRC